MRSALSILLLLLLFILTPVMFVVTSVRFNVATTDFLKRELVKLDVYGLATSQIDQQISHVVIDPQYPVTHEELATLAHQAISETWLRQNLEQMLDGLRTWLTTKRGTELNLPLDLRAPKATLTSGIDSLLTTKLPQLHPCPNKRQPKEEQGICQFAGLTLPQLKEQLNHQGLNPDLINQVLPDTLNLANPDLSRIVGPADTTDPNGSAAKSTQIRHNLELLKARYQQVVVLMNLGLGIYGLLFLLYLAINAERGRRRLLRWGGLALLVIGAVPTAMAMISSPVIEHLALPRLHLDAKTPAQVAQLVPQLIRDTRSAVFNPLLVTGLVFVILGLGGMVGAHWIVTRTKEQPPTTSR